MTQTNEMKLEHILESFEQPEQLESLHYLVEKLPEFTQTIRAMEDKVVFVESVLNDKQSLESMSNEVEQKVNSLHLGQEHLEAVLEIAQLLPQIVPMIKKTEELSTFVSDLLEDTSSVDYLLDGINDVVPVQKGMDIIQETNERFKEDESKPNMSILQMYRLLKDPTVQKGFKYVETLLGVFGEKEMKE